ncbi:MAG: hypothetical protein JWN41_54, partial [Thermoleophilia bacterium]|nr:hypothetical protein [Thermoleophilia bacterium]
PPAGTDPPAGADPPAGGAGTVPGAPGAFGALVGAVPPAGNAGGAAANAVVFGLTRGVVIIIRNIPRGLGVRRCLSFGGAISAAQHHPPARPPVTPPPGRPWPYDASPGRTALTLAATQPRPCTRLRPRATTLAILVDCRLRLKNETLTTIDADSEAASRNPRARTSAPDHRTNRAAPPTVDRREPPRA